MKVQPILNPMVFVKDENSPEFRTHIIARAKEADDPKPFTYQRSQEASCSI